MRRLPNPSVKRDHLPACRLQPAPTSNVICISENEVSFESARITTEEYVSNNLAAIDAKYPMMTCSRQWTIDRTKNIHAREVSRTVPSDMGPANSFWLLFWKQGYVIFECATHQNAGPENVWTKHVSLVRLELPEELKPHRAEIINDIEALLKVYGTGGIYCRATAFKLKFDVRV